MLDTRKKLFGAAAVLAAAVFTSQPVLAQSPQDVHIVLDRGPGGAIFRNPAYAGRAGKVLVQALSGLKLGNGDSLSLFTFGEAGLFNHLDAPDYNRKIDFAHRGAKIDDMPGFMSQLMVEYDKIPQQGVSDLMSRLPDLSHQVDCSKQVTVIFLTNGRELGEVQNGDFVLSGIPGDAQFCGQAQFIGLWAHDADPSSGLRSEARDLFARLASKLGFEDVRIAY